MQKIIISTVTTVHAFRSSEKTVSVEYIPGFASVQYLDAQARRIDDSARVIHRKMGTTNPGRMVRVYRTK